MSYTANVPVTGQSLGQTRDSINANFQKINTDFQVDHVAFDATGEGKHKQSRYISTTGGPTTAAGEATLYCEDDSNGDPQIFFRPENIAASGNKYQMSYYNSGSYSNFGVNTAPSATLTNSFHAWTFLPGGLILNFGRISFTGSGNQTVTFALQFPTAPINLTHTVTASSTAVTNGIRCGYSNISTSQYTLTVDLISGSGSPTYVVFYQAIGY